MKKIAREYCLSPQEQQKVEELSLRLDLTETTAAILYARGMTDEEKMRRFLHPSVKNLLSPFVMQGMNEAVQLICRAREEEWRVAIFGDYDADGIGACAILSRALKRFGISPYLYIPEREQGYGMSIQAIDEIFDEFLPDLIITVDCGISNRREVEYIRQLGAEVIVTDHHELPEVLPDCICINPKFKDDYPYDNLCGAGVAYKLSVALIGEEANELLDFCALSTVADSVPLTGENRDIVFEGLRKMKCALRPTFSELLGKPSELTAQTLAFTLAPRVNAAGRMGDARAALRLFTSENEEEIVQLSQKLQSYNSERQQLCDEVYDRAKTLIRREGAYESAILVVGENWHTGLIGIAAARLAEEFARPVILFVRRGDMLRGSARSVEAVNIFEALRSASEYIEEFGGHAQAAGVNIRAENLEKLRAALNEYLDAHYTREDFEPTLPISAEIEGEFPHKLAEELERLEPFGVGNRRPLFSMTLGRTNAAPIKPLSPHLSLVGKGLDFMYFSGYADKKLLRSDAEKKVVFECNLSTFRGKESLKGFIRAVLYSGGADEADGFENYVRSLGCAQKEVTLLEKNNVEEFLQQRDSACAYGLCVVAAGEAEAAGYRALGAFPREIFRLTSGDVRNVLLISPDAECDLSAYREVLFLSPPAGVPQRTGNAELYAVRGESSFPQDIDLTREGMLEMFRLFRRGEGLAVGESYAEAASLLAAGNIRRGIFALAVFEQLGLVSLEQGVLRVAHGIKTDLGNSSIYQAALALSGRA